jgi:hypothetical protein
LTEPQEQAALLVAQGRLPQAVIAKRVEISKRTLTYLQKEPEFHETVARHRDAFRKAAEQQPTTDLPQCASSGSSTASPPLD